MWQRCGFFFQAPLSTSWLDKKFHLDFVWTPTLPLIWIHAHAVLTCTANNKNIHKMISSWNSITNCAFYKRVAEPFTENAKRYEQACVRISERRSEERERIFHATNSLCKSWPCCDNINPEYLERFHHVVFVRRNLGITVKSRNPEQRPVNLTVRWDTCIHALCMLPLLDHPYKSERQDCILSASQSAVIKPNFYHTECI